MAEFHERPAVMLVLHDVAPSTWADYRAFVEAVDRLGNVPMTWLVVPDFHRHDALEVHPEFCRMLDQRVARGDELALHGHFHEDTEPGPRTARDWFMRRVYTHEGEFYRLSQEDALARLRSGIEMFHRHDWPLEGFVAPGDPGTELAAKPRMGVQIVVFVQIRHHQPGDRHATQSVDGFDERLVIGPGGGGHVVQYQQ